MMGALGNGRRGGRSSSLLLIALISCILLLGFNYWVSNSRNVELQSKLLELEDRMRKLSAESDREQQKAEEEMRRQNEQLELMAETHQRQQESALNTWNREKEILKLNISSSAKMVQDMKNHMKSLLEDVSKRKSELQSCQINMDSISKKASNDMSQCNKQIEAIKEECKGKIAAVKLDKQKTSEKVVPENTDDSMQKVSVSKAKADVPVTNHSDKSVVEPPNGEPDVNSLSKNDVNVQTNEIVVEKGVEGTVILLDPFSKQSNNSETLKRPTNEEVPEVVEDIKEQPSKPSDTVLDEAGILDPKDDDIGIGVEEEEDVIKIRDRKEEDAANGKEDAVMYDNEGEIEKQLSKIKDENQDAGQDLEDDVANYNGNDDNQPESEDDKQAELARM